MFLNTLTQQILFIFIIYLKYKTVTIFLLYRTIQCHKNVHRPHKTWYSITHIIQAYHEITGKLIIVDMIVEPELPSVHLLIETYRLSVIGW
jgi:hypothetical protein